MTSKVFHFHRDVEEIATGWIVTNLKEYRNSAIPKDLIKLIDSDTLERLLTVIIHEPVSITKTEGGYIACI